MVYYILFGVGGVVFAVFLVLYFRFRHTTNTTRTKIFVLATYLGLMAWVIGLGQIIQPFVLGLLPNWGQWIVLGVEVAVFLAVAWFWIRPEFSTTKKEAEEVKTITATGTKTTTPGATPAKKKKKKYRSMKAQMGTSKKRRIPRY